MKFVPTTSYEWWRLKWYPLDEKNIILKGRSDEATCYILLNTRQRIAL